MTAYLKGWEWRTEETVIKYLYDTWWCTEFSQTHIWEILGQLFLERFLKIFLKINIAKRKMVSYKIVKTRKSQKKKRIKKKNIRKQLYTNITPTIFIIALNVKGMNINKNATNRTQLQIGWMLNDRGNQGG